MINDYYTEFFEVLTQLSPIIKPEYNDWVTFVNRLNPTQQQIIVAIDRDTEKVVGTGSVLIQQKIIHNMGKVAHIEDVVVDNNLRGKGLGKELINHFIRGYFDGDGSFSFDTKTLRPHTNLVCASEIFRNQLITILKERGIEIKYYSNISLHIQDKLGNLKFYNYIYENSNIHLIRKKEKYEEFRKHYQYNN